MSQINYTEERYEGILSVRFKTIDLYQHKDTTLLAKFKNQYLKNMFIYLE